MSRKDEHIKYALSQEFGTNDFDKVRFVHQALATTSFDEISLKTSICGLDIPYPFYINAMTGGTDTAYEINDKLSMLASLFNIPIASGSLSIALKDPEVRKSFTILRRNHPGGIIMANLGADKTLIQAQRAKELLTADIMQIHLNVVQELIMPEGERDFRNCEKNIQSIVKEIGIPVIVKEVGFGMSKKTIHSLKSLGVKTIDVSGRGGTNFAKIENLRRDVQLDYLNDWGLSTVESLIEASSVEDIEILASGGVRNALDIVKSLALGAKVVGLSLFFLKLVSTHTLEDSIKEVEKLITEIKTIMTILGTKTIDELKYTEIIVEDSLLSYINQRQINESILLKR